MDEVDSVLIDEARTPLIISGAAENSAKLYNAVNKLIPALIFQEKEDTETYTGEGDYTLDLKSKQAYLTERGQIKIENSLVSAGLLKDGDKLFSSEHVSLLHHVMAALKANTLFTRDVDYVVDENFVKAENVYQGFLYTLGEDNYENAFYLDYQYEYRDVELDYPDFAQYQRVDTIFDL